MEDKLRDIKLSHLGIKVLRFTNLDVLKNIESVMRKIEENLP